MAEDSHRKAAKAALPPPLTTMTRRSQTEVLLVGPIPPAESYVGGIAVLIRMQLAHWALPVSVAHLNTDLWARNHGSTGKVRLQHLAAFIINTARLTWTILLRRPVLVDFHSSSGLGLLKDTFLAWWARWVCQRSLILHIHFAVADAILLRCPLVWRRLELRFILASTDRLAFLSHRIIDELAALLPAGSAARLRAKSLVLPNFTEFPADPADRRQHDDTATIFFIGNIGRRKGAYDLVRAAARLAARLTTPFRVALAGPFDSDEDQQRITDLANALGVANRLRFLGSISGQAKVDAFLKADIFALPSYGEGVPLSMLEAMAYALPVVVTDVGGIPETITDGKEGIMIQPGDIEALVAALARLIANGGHGWWVERVIVNRHSRTPETTRCSRVPGGRRNIRCNQSRNFSCVRPGAIHVGSDDKLASAEAVADVMDCFSAPEVQYVCAGIGYTNQNWELVRDWPATQPKFRNFLLGRQVSHFGFACKRAVYEQIGPFDQAYDVSADFDFFLRLSKRKLCGTALDSRVALMKLGGNSSKNLKNILRGNFQILQSGWSHYGPLVLLHFLAKPFIKLCQFPRAAWHNGISRRAKVNIEVPNAS